MFPCAFSSICNFLELAVNQRLLSFVPEKRLIFVFLNECVCKSAKFREKWIERVRAFFSGRSLCFIWVSSAFSFVWNVSYAFGFHAHAASETSLRFLNSQLFSAFVFFVSIARPTNVRVYDDEENNRVLVVASHTISVRPSVSLGDLTFFGVFVLVQFCPTQKQTKNGKLID